MIYGGLPQIVSFQSERQKAESISVQICLSANSRNIFNGDPYAVNAHTEATAYRFTIRFDLISSIKSGLFECFALSGSQRFFTDLNSVRLCILRPKLNCLSSKQGHRSISVTYVGRNFQKWCHSLDPCLSFLWLSEIQWIAHFCNFSSNSRCSA